MEWPSLLRSPRQGRSGDQSMTAAATKKVRCGIYTRVSTEAGLDQNFNSLDAQYDAAQAYIRSQAHAGWTLIRHAAQPLLRWRGPLQGCNLSRATACANGPRSV